jgi:hypothetical protein
MITYKAVVPNRGAAKFQISAFFIDHLLHRVLQTVKFNPAGVPPKFF